MGFPFLSNAKRQRKQRDGLCLSSTVPKIKWDSNPPLPLWLLGYGKPLPLPFSKTLPRSMLLDPSFRMALDF